MTDSSYQGFFNSYIYFFDWKINLLTCIITIIDSPNPGYYSEFLLLLLILKTNLFYRKSDQGLIINFY
jgi:hypothetical protein